MTELLIYRLGQVPQLNYIKFLQLIGIELDAGAAGADRAGVSGAERLCAVERARSGADAGERRRRPDGGSPIVFETETAVDRLAGADGRGSRL